MAARNKKSEATTSNKRTEKVPSVAWKSSSSPSISTLLHADFVTQQQHSDEPPAKQAKAQPLPSSQIQNKEIEKLTTSGSSDVNAHASNSNQESNNSTSLMPQQITKETMLQMMSRGQAWPGFNLLPGMKSGLLESMNGTTFPFGGINGMTFLPEARNTQLKSRAKKRKEKDISPDDQKAEDSDSRRMQCWNCSPDCINKGQGPEKHHVAGMCGRCHQRWKKHPKERWGITRCVSKCRCERCDDSRRDAEYAARGNGLENFKRIVDETIIAGTQTTLLHRLTKHLIKSYEEGDVDELVMSPLLTLSSLVGVPNVKPSAINDHNWEPFSVFLNIDGLPASSFMGYFDLTSIPFFLACCLRVSVTDAPHETVSAIKLKVGKAERKLRVAFNAAGDFQVYLSPKEDRISNSSTAATSTAV